MDVLFGGVSGVWPQMDVNPDIKKCVDIIVNKLLNSHSVNEYEFPSSFSSIERQFVTNYCIKMGLKAKTRRNGTEKAIIAFKPQLSTIISQNSSYGLTAFAQNTIKTLLQRFPASDKYWTETSNLSFGNNHISFETNRELNCTTGRLSNIVPQIPIPPPFASGRVDELTLFRQSLPIWQKRNEIIEAIGLNTNRILLISGQTGCGKTTQIPQFILEYCNVMKKACRVVCAEPTSLLAHSVAERVSNERSEQIGQTVGYQIQLENKVSPRTLLTFCTNGILLRTLMGGESSLQSLTHVIIDEIQEKDRFTEFLLLIMRELMEKHRNFKLILMSSNSQTIQFYSQYFKCCQTFDIISAKPCAQHYFIEDVLKMTSYMSESMKNFKESIETKENQKQILNQWMDEISVSTLSDYAIATGFASYQSDVSPFTAFDPNRVITFGSVIAERDELDVFLKLKIDSYLQNAWTQGTDYAFQHLVDLIVHQHISINYKHSTSGVTALIAAVSHNKITLVESFLRYGADINLCTPNDWNVIQWAKHFKHKQMTEFLEAYQKCIGNQMTNNEINLYNSPDMREGDKEILDVYYHSLLDNNCLEFDVDMICHLINYIINNSEKLCPEQKNGSILVFLAGYEEVMKLREKLVNDSKIFDANKYALFTLYPEMPNIDLKRAFRRMPSDGRKIILSTHIAESCFTIDDVSFVIDSGKVMEKRFDESTGFTYYISEWISKTNAIQRRNRLKTSICFHLYNRNQFKCFDDYQSSDLNKKSIFELCLQTKLLAPNNVSIKEFLSKALNPPSFETIKKSVILLKTIGALGSSEQLTELGLHLFDLPVEPNLGKMVLYSVVLKCLDPVLTIVCSLSCRNPFVVPQNQASRKRTAFAMRKKLSAKTLSDHIILLRGFHNWQKAKHDNCEKEFCEQNFISSAAMEMIVNKRAQLLGQLRASGFVRTRGVGDIRNLNQNSDNWAVVKAALCAGGYPYIVRIDRERNQLITHNEVNVHFHPNSVLNTCSLDSKESIDKTDSQVLETLPTDWLLYNNLIKSGDICFVECSTLITPITVALFAGNIQIPIDSYIQNKYRSVGAQFGDYESDSESEDKTEKEKYVIKIDNWIDFKLEPQIASLSLQLRQKFNALFQRRMSSPSKPMTPADDIIIKTMVEALTLEEKNLGLQQPVGIGQIPRPMSTDFCPPVSNIPLNSPLTKNAFQRQPN